MTVDELLKKIQERTDEDPIEAALWFAACQEARGVFDAYSVKDLANVIREGEPLRDGKLMTRWDLHQWVDDINANGFNNEPWDWLDAALDQHFGRS